MPAIYTLRHTIVEAEIDQQGHVNNVEYVKWMQQAAVEHSTAQGWPPQRYERIGSVWVVRSHTIEYLQPAFLGQSIEVETWVVDFRKIQSRRKYKIVRPSDAALLATAETNWAFIGLEHHVPRRVPQELIDSFEVVDEA